MPTVLSGAKSNIARPRLPETILAEAEQHWLFTDEELSNTPSILDGMPLEKERECRTKGLNFIIQVGVMLKLPQLTLTSAGVFFNRALMRISMMPSAEMKASGDKGLHHYQIAATALFIATKTEETIRRTKDLIISCIRVAQKQPSLMVDELTSKDFWRWRDTLIINEDILLEALCFDMTVPSPHKILFDILKMLGVEHKKKLRNASWAFVNDSCLTVLCLKVRANVIAAAAVWCGTRFCEMDPTFPPEANSQEELNAATPLGDVIPQLSVPQVPWWTKIGIRLGDIKRTVNYMADLYAPAARSGEERSIYADVHSEIEEGDDDDHPAALDLSEHSEGPQNSNGHLRGGDANGSSSDRRNVRSSVLNGRSVSPNESRGVKRIHDGTPKPEEGASTPAGSEEGEVEE